MGIHDTRLIDSQLVARCQICLNYLPIEYYFSPGDTLFCQECSTEYTLESVHPVRISVHEGGYRDSYIHESFSEK